MNNLSIKTFNNELLRKLDIPLTKVKYTLSILQIYWNYTFKVYLKYTSSIPEAYYKYTSSILQVYFNLWNYRRRSIPQVYIISTKEVHLKHICEIKWAFQSKLEVYFKYSLSILKVYFLEVCYKYTLRILQLYFRSML